MVNKTRAFILDGLALIPGLNILASIAECNSARTNLGSITKIRDLRAIVGKDNFDKSATWKKHLFAIDDIFRAQEKIHSNIPSSSGVYDKEKNRFNNRLIRTLGHIVDKIPALDASKPLPEETLRALRLDQELCRDISIKGALPISDELNEIEKQEKFRFKIGLLYLIPIIGALASMVIHCVKKNSSKKIELTQLPKQNLTTAQMSAQIKSGLNQLNLSEIKEGCCFIRAVFEKGEVKNQFLFKNSNQPPLSKKEVEDSIEKIDQFVQSASKDLGAFQQFYWITYYRGTENNLGMAHGDSSLTKEGSRGGAGVAKGASAAKGTVYFADAIGFKFSDYLAKGGELIPGPLYQELN